MSFHIEKFTPIFELHWIDFLSPIRNNPTFMKKYYLFILDKTNKLSFHAQGAGSNKNICLIIIWT